jgi:hypothetical protein
MEVQTMSTLRAAVPPAPHADARGEIVEIALLLPKNRAEALVSLSRQRHQSVGQILRTLIDRALVEAD